MDDTVSRLIPCQSAYVCIGAQSGRFEGAFDLTRMGIMLDGSVI
jgi:hypothetical protein